MTIIRSQWHFGISKTDKYETKDEDEDLSPKEPIKLDDGSGYKCPYSPCPYGAEAGKPKASVQTHIRTKHTRETPYSCRNCGAKFVTTSALGYHKKTGKCPGFTP